jgi:DNA-directed RNA polymerase specialized sigma24 family protein
MAAAIDSGSSHTNWSMIFYAARGDALPASTAMDHLVRRYWPSVYAYIRRTGRDVHEASDLAQGFVCDVIIGRHLFHHADPARGRFRTLLLNALKNYLREQHRHEHRQKRSNDGVKPLQIDPAEMAAVESSLHLTPEAAFSAQWNATLIRRVLERVRLGCLSSGLDAHWIIFESRVVKPMLFGEPPGNYAQLVERLSLHDAGQAANMMVTVKRRFSRELYAEISQTVSDPNETEEELRELLQELEQHT